MDLENCISPIEDCTEVTYNGEQLNDAYVLFTIPQIILNQEPSEILALKFSSNYYCDADPNHHLSQCNVSLTFTNNLHELTDNYDYEVTCKSMSFEGQYHELLFVHRETRVSETINFKRLFLSRNSNLAHLCFCIRRFNKLQSLPNCEINVGRMLLETSIYSDVSLIVGEKIFKVHRQVLSSSSNVFRAMFTHEMSETQQGIVKIDDFDSEVIEEMLNYLYTGKSVNVAAMPRELFETAHKYEIYDLRKECEEYFLFNLYHENVVEMLDLSNLYGLTNLKSHALSFIRNHEEEMAREESFRHFLCRDLKVETLPNTLILCAKYDISEVKIEAFKFIKKHSRQLTENKDFLNLFNLYPDLIKEIFIFIHSLSDVE